MMPTLKNHQTYVFLLTVITFFAAPATAGIFDEVNSTLRNIQDTISETVRTKKEAEGAVDGSTETQKPRPEQTQPPAPTVGYQDRPRYDASWVREIQQRLTDLGFIPGVVDGQFGGKTANAIKAFERSRRLPVTGQPTPRFMDVLRDQTQGVASRELPGGVNPKTVTERSTAPVVAGAAPPTGSTIEAQPPVPNVSESSAETTTTQTPSSGAPARSADTAASRDITKLPRSFGTDRLTVKGVTIGMKGADVTKTLEARGFTAQQAPKLSGSSSFYNFTCPNCRRTAPPEPTTDFDMKDPVSTHISVNYTLDRESNTWLVEDISEDFTLNVRTRSSRDAATAQTYALYQALVRQHGEPNTCNVVRGEEHDWCYWYRYRDNLRDQLLWTWGAGMSPNIGLSTTKWHN